MASKVNVALLAGLFLGFSFLYYREHDPAPTGPAATAVTAPSETAEATAALAPIAAAQPTSTLPSPPGVLGSFDRAADGTPIPELPTTAPKRIRIGVALFTYDGAQLAEKKGRTRDVALEAAKKAISSNAADFAKLVVSGDPGSAPDIGFVKRGIIERRAEFAIFQLAPGETLKEPVDTPRGFWVAKRIE